MNKRTVIIILTVICIFSFIIRFVYQFKGVFGSGFVNFMETDAWNRMYYALSMRDMGFFESIGYMSNNNLLFSWIVSVFGRFLPIEGVGAWLPPIMAIATVVAVYFLAKELFNQKIGLMSALFVGVIPSELFHRSQLGFTDHHILEVLLLVLVILFYIKSVKHERVINKYTLIAGISTYLYVLNWVSGIYLISFMLVLCAAGMVIYNISTRQNKWREIPSFLLPLVIALVIYLPTGGYEKFLFLIPGHETQLASQTASEIMATISTKTSEQTISELMPLFSPYGKFSLVVVISNLHLFFFTTILGMVFLWKHRTDRNVIIFAIITLVVFIIAINQRRFMYYATVNIAILSAFAIFELTQLLKRKSAWNAVMIVVILVLISMPICKNMGMSRAGFMPVEWKQALEWVKNQPGSGYVTAWGDYGHWIKYVSGREPNYLPGPGGNAIADFLLTSDQSRGKELLTELRTEYLIVDELTINQKSYALSIYAGYKPQSKQETLGYRIYYGKEPPDYLTLAYESQSIKIFKSYLQLKGG